MGDVAELSVFAFFVIAALRGATPIALAAVGGAFSAQVNVFNVSLEAMMLCGAFAGFVVSDRTGSALAGLAVGALAGLVVALVVAFIIIDLGGDEIVTGITANLGAIGLTALLLNSVYGSQGSYYSTSAGLVRPIGSDALAQVPLVGPILNGLDPVMIAALVLVVVAHVFTFRTRHGMRFRAIGSKEAAVTSAGVQTRRYKYAAFIVSGLLAGVGGAYLPLSGLSLFTVNMTAGVGYIALAAVLFGVGMPRRVALAAYLFGAATAAAFRLQNIGLPSELVLALPYLATIAALVWRSLSEKRPRRRVDAPLVLNA
jgi:simple sugar transport system permease protein